MNTENIVKPLILKIPIECLGKCGFWGHPNYNNYCSKCFKSLNDKNELSSNQEGTATGVSSNELECKIIQKAVDRCWKCNKKIGLIGIKCKCGYIFCSNHRLPENHNPCNFDHKTVGRKELVSKNPQICSKKIDKI